MSRFSVDAGLAATDLAFIRYSTAGVLLLPWLARKQLRDAGGIGWLRAAVLALLAGPLFVLVGTSAFAFTSLSHSAVIQLGTVTLLGIGLSALFSGEHIGKRQVIGLITIIAGWAVTAGPGLLAGGSQAWKGDLLFSRQPERCGRCSLCSSGGGAPTRWPPQPASRSFHFWSMPPHILSSVGRSRFFRSLPGLILQLVVALGVVSGIVALFAFDRTVSHLGAARASLFPALAPGVAILLGIPLADEIPTEMQIVGLVILTTGLVIAIRGDSPSGEPKL